MRKIGLIFFCLLISQQISAQVSLSGNHFSKDGQLYKYSQYKEVFMNPEAQKEFQKARINMTVSQVFAYSGGGVLGFGLASALFGKKEEVRNGVVYQVKPNGWALVGIGAGLIGVAIPFAITASKKAKNAVDIENGDGSTAFKPHFKLESAGTGVSLSYNF